MAFVNKHFFSAGNSDVSLKTRERDEAAERRKKGFHSVRLAGSLFFRVSRLNTNNWVKIVNQKTTKHRGEFCRGPRGVMYKRWG